ncbi:MAG TPA: SufD family Fe-S cluster assembly protein [Patescibacteria group bacterium]|jgi:hypothetical protein|nr:SufD family Fe-S cluster assembly protein [Patescibacteria group bacterium]
MYTFNRQGNSTVLHVFEYTVIHDPIHITIPYTRLRIIAEQGTCFNVVDSCYDIHQEITMSVGANATICYYMNDIIKKEKQCTRIMHATIAQNGWVGVIGTLQCAGFFSLQCTALLSDSNAHFFSGSRIIVLSKGKYYQKITQEHVACQTTSDSRLYGIIESLGELESNGLIMIESKAHRSVAEHSTKCLTAGPHAKASAKPMLEIAPKDVFVKHGAAIGPLNKDLILSLGYRGIAPDRAISLLKEAFLAQFDLYMPSWVKKRLTDCFNEKLIQSLSIKKQD